MRRRGLLALVGTGITTALSGCGGGNAGDGGGPAAAAPPTEEAIELLEHELRRLDEDSLAETVEVAGRARNTTDAEIPGVQFRVTYLDENGDELQEQVTDGRDVGPSREWSFEIGFNGTGSSAREVDDYEIEVGDEFE